MILPHPDAQGPTGGGGGGDGGLGDLTPNPAMMPAAAPGRRAASVQLRAATDSDAASDRELLDPANQALGGALRVTYRLLQVTMFGLVVWFVLSGMQSVRETERGLRVVFGQLQAEELPAGFHFSLPRPFGEVLRVESGEQRLLLTDEFYPSLSPQSRDKPPQELIGEGRDSVDPLRDGSLVTGDGNIVHAKLEVSFRRSRAVQWALRVDPRTERDLVRFAVGRAAVRAAAGMTIDEFLKGVESPSAAAARERRRELFLGMEEQTRRLAQEELDRVESGVVISSLKLVGATPPLRLINDFSRVDTAQAESNTAKNQANQERNTRLSGAAGQAADDVLRLISRYELLTAQPDRAAEAAAVMADLRAVLTAPPDPDGVTRVTLQSEQGRKLEVKLAGKAANVLNEARQYRSSVVSRAQADLELFRAKLAAFNANPQVMLAGEWSAAYARFLSRDTVQVWAIPLSTGTLQLDLNRDPDIQREQERIRTAAATARELEATAAENERNRQEGLLAPKQQGP